jgi:hypothetical protein
MSTKDYIPASPDTFNVYQENFVNQVDENAPRWGTAPFAIMPLHEQQAVWNTVYPKAANPQNRTPADVLERQEAQALAQSHRKPLCAAGKDVGIWEI